MIRSMSCALVLLTAGFVPAAEQELHVVVCGAPSFDLITRSSAGAVVRVDRPDKEVVLLVSGQQAIEWEITATPKTKLTKVIFGGYVRQSWKVPPGVETDELSFESVKQRLLPLSIEAPQSIDAPAFRSFTRSLRNYTGLEIASFQSASRFDHRKPFVVDAVQKDERLNSDFPKVTPAAQVPKFKFEATRVVYGKEPRDVRRTFGEFTQAGPAADGFVPMPNGIGRLTFDTNAKTYYGTEGTSLSVVDLKLGTSKKMDPPANNPVGFGSLTYDAKRDRVIATNGYSVHEYDVKNGGKWKHLANGDGMSSYAAFAWHAKSDTLFAFGVERDKAREALIPTFYELNPDGTLALKNALGSPLFPSILGEYGWGDAQLIDLGRDLALLVHREDRGGRGAPVRHEAFLYVINPKSGKVQLAWKE